MIIFLSLSSAGAMERSDVLPPSRPGDEPFTCPHSAPHSQAPVEFQRDSASLRHKACGHSLVRKTQTVAAANAVALLCSRRFLLFPSVYLTRQITSEAAALSPRNPADRYAINPNCTKAASFPGRDADKIFDSHILFLVRVREVAAATSNTIFNLKA